MKNQIKIKKDFTRSNIAMLLGIISQGQTFTHIDHVDCKYKKTKNKLKKLFGEKVPNFYVSNDILWVVSIKSFYYKGKLSEYLMVYPAAECKGKFKKYSL